MDGEGKNRISRKNRPPQLDLETKLKCGRNQEVVQVQINGELVQRCVPKNIVAPENKQVCPPGYEQVALTDGKVVCRLKCRRHEVRSGEDQECTLTCPGNLEKVTTSKGESYCKMTNEFCAEQKTGRNFASLSGRSCTANVPRRVSACPANSLLMRYNRNRVCVSENGLTGQFVGRYHKSTSMPLDLKYPIWTEAELNKAQELGDRTKKAMLKHRKAAADAMLTTAEIAERKAAARSVAADAMPTTAADAADENPATAADDKQKNNNLVPLATASKQSGKKKKKGVPTQTKGVPTQTMTMRTRNQRGGRRSVHQRRRRHSVRRSRRR